MTDNARTQAALYSAPVIDLPRIAPGAREAARVALMASELESAARRLENALVASLERFAPDSVITTLTGMRQLGHEQIPELRERLAEVAQMATEAQSGDKPPFEIWRMLNNSLASSLQWVAELAQAATKVEEMPLADSDADQDDPSWRQYELRIAPEHPVSAEDCHNALRSASSARRGEGGTVARYRLLDDGEVRLSVHSWDLQHAVGQAQALMREAGMEGQLRST